MSIQELSSSYWCHRCFARISLTGDGSEPVCPTCREGFLEQIEMTEIQGIQGIDRVQGRIERAIERRIGGIEALPAALLFASYLAASNRRSRERSTNATGREGFRRRFLRRFNSNSNTNTNSSSNSNSNTNVSATENHHDLVHDNYVIDNNHDLICDDHASNNHHDFMYEIHANNNHGTSHDSMHETKGLATPVNGIELSIQPQYCRPRKTKDNGSEDGNNESCTGLKAFIGDLKQEFVALEDVYVWHALLGYWGGVRIDAEESFGSVLEQPVRSPGLITTMEDLAVDMLVDDLIGIIPPENAFDFYDRMHSYLAWNGVSGVKLDVIQASLMVLSFVVNLAMITDVMCHRLGS